MVSILALESRRIKPFPLLQGSMPKVCTIQNHAFFKSSPSQGKYRQLPGPFLTLHFSRLPHGLNSTSQETLQSIHPSMHPSILPNVVSRAEHCA